MCVPVDVDVGDGEGEPGRKKGTRDGGKSAKVMSGFILCLILAACGATRDTSCPGAHLKSIRGEENVRVSSHWVT